MESELGLTIMIEADMFPGPLGMAVLAFSTEAPGVFVFMLMTGITIRLDFYLIRVFFVTCSTNHFDVSST